MILKKIVSNALHPLKKEESPQRVDVQSSIARERWLRFKSIRRSYVSLWIFIGLTLFATFAEFFINSRPIALFYEGNLYFPLYGKFYSGEFFGEDYTHETDYRQLAKRLNAKGVKGWVWMPLVQWGPYEFDLETTSSVSQEKKSILPSKAERGNLYPPFAPSRRHLLGSDPSGRDILARLVYGFRYAIFFSLAVTGLCYLIGVAVGALMGYWGGWFDIVMQRLIEILGQIPYLYVIMILVSILKPSLGLFILINVVVGWTGPTWNIRALTYREREKEHVLAAKTMGASTRRIITVHILPDLLVVLITTLPFSIISGINGLTSLDYLGFGLQPPTPSWGELLRVGQENLQSLWILSSVVLSIVLVLVVVAFIGEGIREAFDPKRYTKYE